MDSSGMIINKMPHIPPRLIIPPLPPSIGDVDIGTNPASCRTLTYGDKTSTSLTIAHQEEEDDDSICSPSDDDYPPASPVATRSPRPGSSCYALRAAVANLTFWDDFAAEKIGSGFFSDVYKIRHHGNGNVMVVKISKSRNSRQNQQKMLQELELLNKLNHPNVIRYLGACVKDGHIHPLLELVSGGPLEDILKDETVPLSWQQKASLATDIARGMEYLHSRNVCHRDLKSENCLVRKLSDDQLEAVVADLGLARVVTLDDDDSSPGESPRRMSLVGSPYWMAPEILRGEEYTKTVDVFSFGIILCEIMARIPADPDDLPRTNLFGLDVDGFRSMCPDCPADMLQIAGDCCSMDPTRRPSFSEIYHRLCHISYKMSSATTEDQSTPRIPDEPSLVPITDDSTHSDDDRQTTDALPEITTHEHEEGKRTMQTSADPTTNHDSISDVHKLAPMTDQSKRSTRVRRALYILSALSVLVTLFMLNFWRSIYTLISVFVPLSWATLYRVTITQWWKEHQMTQKVIGFLHILGRRLSWGSLPPPPPQSTEKKRRTGRSGINMLELKSKKSNNNGCQTNNKSIDNFENGANSQELNSKVDAAATHASGLSKNGVTLKLSRDKSFGEGNSDEESLVKMIPINLIPRRRLSRPLIRRGSFGIHDSIEESADESTG